ncbi:hypothetical protein P872_05845 [Rhodonellum psychrophilum GCM71 = DSM 17998]|uniref:Uncharacterized protein n=2 Tax=Rhodonellum TaxID=336827 RepID=U5C2Y3_9BACT|nr:MULTISPECIES: hypothetical protein [Rhodonellum]ERM82547.1 hypothetical protein P872_05845 [Rhodonellum psychrophilum GCM71 = DSM 17998]SDY53955.1 hypothetical protein SAMN05444412_101469 [Rhodonellum ikkaensis]
MDFNQEFKHPPINTGDWFLTILISNIPLIGLIMLVVWAVDKENNPNKSNWAKAKLIWYLVGFGFAMMVLFFVGFGTFLGFFNNFGANEF